MSQAEPWEALQQEEGRPVLLTGLPITAQPCSLMGFAFSAPTLGEVSVTPRETRILERGTWPAQGHMGLPQSWGRHRRMSQVWPAEAGGQQPLAGQGRSPAQPHRANWPLGEGEQMASPGTYLFR